MTLTPILFHFAGSSDSMSCAAEKLHARGYDFSPSPTRMVSHLLVDAPCKGDYTNIMKLLSPEVRVIGGRLSHPAFEGFSCFDLLSDPLYLSKNAAITAHCTLKILLPLLPITLEGCSILILGWGRIGKCLAQLLSRLGAQITVFARKTADRAMAEALGYSSTTTDGDLRQYRAIINTIPAAVLSQEQLSQCDCPKIELASLPGLCGSNVVSALGLPSKLAPESSGELIEQTILRFMKEDAL